eukprot:gene6840-9364_t
MANVKISHHIKKLVSSLAISSHCESNVDLITKNLRLRHKEYELESYQDIRATVDEVLPSLLAGNTSPRLEENLPLSLNQVISSQYSNSGKRLRQIEGLDQSQPSVVAPLNTENSSEQVNTGEKRLMKRLKSNENIAKSNYSSQKNKTHNNGSNQNLPFFDSLTEQSKKDGSSFLITRPLTRLSNLAGLDTILNQIKELIFYPIKYPLLYNRLGVRPPCGILLYGASGCGKTTLASAIAGELGLPFFKANGPELVGGTSGESEERILQMFEAAAKIAPSVLFIDSIDVIAGKKDTNQRGMDKRIVSQLVDSIDYISSLGSNKSEPLNQVSPQQEKNDNNTSNNNNSNILPIKSNVKHGLDTTETQVKSNMVILIAATNKPDSIDPGVRGRFSREICLPIPDAPSRSKILELMSSAMKISNDVDFLTLGKLTPGFVGADLQALAREAGMTAVSRIVRSKESNTSASLNDFHANVVMDVMDEWQEESNVYVEMNDFILASKTIQPTAKREGFAVAPDVTWSDVGALSEVREELLHNVLEPIAHPERFRSLGLEVPAGVLFFGPPGCGKTLLAKALANQSGANFISVKGPELLNKFVGESESQVRQVFSRARASAPCVIFFDELDALCPKRGSGFDGGGSGNGVSERVVNQLLTELDGLESRRDVYIIAATNRLELIDDAMLRPGRLGKLLYVPLPSPADRVSILKAITRKVTIEPYDTEKLTGVNLELIGHDNRADGFSGADLAALVREAGLAVVRDLIDNHAFDDMNANFISIPSNKASLVELSSDESPQLLSSDESLKSSAQLQPTLMEKLVPCITSKHFELAFDRVKPSVSSQDRKRFELVQSYLKSGMSAIQALSKAADAGFY